TEIMTIADLNEMEARVDVGEVDVPLVQLGQKARLEVDSFRDRKFAGLVTEIANAAKTQGMGTQAEATKFEVRIRVQDKDRFRPGMSVTAEIETRHRTNVLAVPIQSVTTRLPTNTVAGATGTKAPRKEEEDDGLVDERRRPREAVKPVEVVFTVADGRAVMKPVTRGISDDTHVEITEGVTEGDAVVSGGFRAINRELEHGKLVKLDDGKGQKAGN
ncbi:MAG TPA: efflux RND transporter periplasmic adaptor subunit, partial [Verrucomicrobiota bacterium]|nr:efflux RND transporter periplasmic adaptor subunit [Verrucomicrobiota bacterium]